MLWHGHLTSTLRSFNHWALPTLLIALMISLLLALSSRRLRLHSIILRAQMMEFYHPSWAQALHTAFYFWEGSPLSKLVLPRSGTFRWPQPQVFSRKYCHTNGRRTAVQMGGVLQYKWEVYCWVSLSSSLRSQEGATIQMGAYCRVNWRCAAVLSPEPVGVGVSKTLLTRIHLQIASGSKVRALLYNNIICCATVTRPLISVGQMKKEHAWPEICLEWLFSLTLGMLGRSHIRVVGSDDLPQSTCHHFSWWWLYLRLFTPLLPPGLYGMRLLGQKNLLITSLCFNGLLLAIQFTYLMKMLLSLMILKWCSLRWTRWIYWRLPLEIFLLYCLHCILVLCNHHTHHLRLYLLLHLRMLYLPSSSVLTYNLGNQDPPSEDEEGGGTHEPGKKEKESQSHDSLGWTRQG